MEPPVLPPPGIVSRPVDFKLKPGWHYDQSHRVFVGEKHNQFAPKDLPAGTRIEYKVPDLASKPRLSKAERELQRYMQMVLPPQFAPESVLNRVKRWSFVEEVHLAPEVSLPRGIQVPSPPRRQGGGALPAPGNSPQRRR
jgi:hypothetical protein